jgi:hypothetical protein
MRSNSSSSKLYFVGNGAANPRGTQAVLVIMDAILKTANSTAGVSERNSELLVNWRRSKISSLQTF